MESVKQIAIATTILMLDLMSVNLVTRTWQQIVSVWKKCGAVISRREAEGTTIVNSYVIQRKLKVVIIGEVIVMYVFKQGVRILVFTKMSLEPVKATENVIILIIVRKLAFHNTRFAFYMGIQSFDVH